MKNTLIALIALISIPSFAFECKVGPKKKSVKVSESGNYLIRDHGYVYMIKYDSEDGYLCLSIEGGPNNLNVTHDSYGPKKSYLTLGKKGEFSNIAIYCE